MNDTKIDAMLETLQTITKDITDMKKEMTDVKRDMIDMKKDMTDMKNDMTDMKKDMTDMKKDMTDMKEDMTNMKKDMANMKEDILGLKEETKDIRLHIENVTDKNISLLAENYCNLVQKLDENNKVTDSQLAYQIKVNYLISDMEKVKQVVAEIKKRIS